MEIKETKTDKLGNGLYSVNERYYYLTFKEKDKYDENRYIFQSFDMERFLKDAKENYNIEDYIAEFKLEVIEDSTYRVKKIEII